MPSLRRAEYYHERADALRFAAGEPCSPDNRDTLLYFADDLDELASKAELAAAMLRRAQANC